MSQSPTLVLRFRDIERAEGQTILLHRECISEHGATWWGWLHRAYEDVPVETLRTLSPLGGERIDVCLYDTGQGKLYRARCDQIDCPNGFSELSPEVQMTPSYYNGKEAPAWFRFVSIEEVDDSWILGRVCESMPSATSECSIDLVGAQVFKLSDLRRQEVTLWVIS